MLPCNVIVQELGSGSVGIATINPLAAMQKIDNPALRAIATEVATRLQAVVASV